MYKSPSLKKIGLLSHMGWGNLGDAAIQEAMVQNIRRYCPDAKIYGFSLNPEDTEKRHGITSYPIGRTYQTATQPQPLRSKEADLYKALKSRLKRVQPLYLLVKMVRRRFSLFSATRDEILFLRRSYNILKGLDLLIISGGGNLLDNWGGPWAHPYNLFKWAIIAKVARTRFIAVSVGAGPIKSKLSKFFIKWSLCLANYRSYRDEKSRKLIESINFRRKGYVFPDLAYSLQLDQNKERLLRDGRSFPTVGISPFAYFNPRIWHTKDVRVYESYIKELALFVAMLIERGYRILFFQSQYRHDLPVINDLKKILINKGTLNRDESIIDEPIYTVSDLISRISLADIVVASRYHSLLLSHLLYKPTLAISYHPKVQTLMDEMGLSEYCLDIETFDSKSLGEKFLLLESNKSSVKIQIEEKVQIYRNQLESQYAYLFRSDM